MNYMRIIFKKFKARMIVGCILAVIALLAVSVIVFYQSSQFRQNSPWGNGWKES